MNLPRHLLGLTNPVEEAPMILRKLAAAAALGALVLAFMVAGATAAYAAVPSPPTIDELFTPWITSDSQLEFQGNMDADVTQIDIYVTNDAVTDSLYCTLPTTPGATVWFTCAPTSATLVLGDNYLSATATNADGTSVPGPAITVTLVNAPTITSPADGVYTNDYQPTFQGTSDGSYFDVYTSDFLTHLCGGTVVNQAWNCTAGTLPDGDYTYQVETTFGATTIFSTTQVLHIDTVLTPSFTVIDGPAGVVEGSGVLQSSSTNPTPTITGTSEPSATITLWQDYVEVGCVGGAAVADITGNWACTLVEPLTASGMYTFASQQTDPAGNTNVGGSPDIQLEYTYTYVAPPPPPPPPPTPTVIPRPPAIAPILAPSWLLRFQSTSDYPKPGDAVTLIGSDLPPGSTVSAELHSTPVALGTSVVKDDGTFVLSAVIPTTVEYGAHHYVVTVTPTDRPAQTAEIPVTVLFVAPAAAVSPVPPDTAPPDSSPPDNASPDNASGNSTSAGGIPADAVRNTPTAPNSLSDSLPTLFDIISNPLVIAAGAASSLVLLFLVALPAEILNSTLDENYERMFGKLPKVRVPWLARLRDRLKRTPIIGGASLTLLAALILSFADPNFGFDLASLRLFLACMIGMFLLGYVANAITGLLIRKRWSIASVITLQPFGLLIALAGVVLSRVLDFAPGLLIGLVLGLSLSASASVKEESRAVFTWAGVVLGVSALGWLVYSVSSGIVVPGTFLGSLFDDSLVAIATEGISGLVIGLLPLGFLDGRSVFRHSKWQWLATYTATLFAFFVIVVPSGALWGGINESFWVWLIVLLAFAAVSIGTYFWFRTHPEPEESIDVSDVEQAKVSGAAPPSLRG